MFKMKTLQRSLAGVVLLAALPMAVMAQGKEPVKVGLVSSKSGVFAQQGEEVMRAIKFAIDEANAKGGVDGRKIEVKEADDEGTPDAGRREAEKLARDGYNLLIGAIPSSISLAIAQNLDRWDAAYFVVASKSDKLTGDTCKPRSFRTNHSDAMDIAMINAWAKNIKGNKFAVIAADYVWGRDSGESFKKAAEASGKSVPLSLYVPMGTKDFSPYIAQLKAANVDGIWVAEVGRALLGREQPVDHAGRARERGLEPRHVHDVDPDPDDHAVSLPPRQGGHELVRRCEFNVDVQIVLQLWQALAFNQALELARATALAVNAPVDAALCMKTRETSPQTRLPWKERRKNIRGAFFVLGDLTGRHVVVVDDVLTTGATLNELARNLKRAGAASVTGWVVARTVAAGGSAA